jgi:hypothetical protein
MSESVPVTQQDHEVAQEIWNLWSCNSLKDYMMKYMMLDVYLLADVFETFRKTALNEDGLDPAHFYSIPGLAWSAALKSLTEDGLELLQELNMYEFFEAGIRGGMTFVNKHLVRSTDDTQLLYIDVNNLYGWALSQFLPCSGFKWIMDDNELAQILHQLPDETANFGYVLEVDLRVDQRFHDALSDLPPAPVRQRPPGTRTQKLLLTLTDKLHYVVHSALLKFYIEVMHVEVVKVHRAIKFNQAPVFRNFINSNTAKRASSTEKFQKDYYKLKNNALYGKTVENLRKRNDLRLCNTAKKMETYASKPYFRRKIEIAQDLIAVILNKDLICLNRPVYIGQAVLDLSKLRMYRLQYVELQRFRDMFPGSEINIVAGDTDSFFLEVKGIDLESQLLPAMVQDGMLDTSNYPATSALFSKRFENKVGLFKDESGGSEKYKEWIFLRPKCYSMLCEDGSAHPKAKGVKRGTALSHQSYLEVYDSFKPDDPTAPPAKRLRVDQRGIRSENHQLRTVVYSKVALSVMDDKRQWVAQNRSLPYGHYSLN